MPSAVEKWPRVWLDWGCSEIDGFNIQADRKTARAYSTTHLVGLDAGQWDVDDMALRVTCEGSDQGRLSGTRRTMEQ